MEQLSSGYVAVNKHVNFEKVTLPERVTHQRDDEEDGKHHRDDADGTDH